MPANVETAFYAKTPAWHGLGTVVADTQSSEDALRLAELDWDVIQEPIFMRDGTEIPERMVNIRSTDRAIFGIVSDHYKIVQNREAFAFVDDLLENDISPIKFESAGALDGGRRVWMLAHMPARLIMGDEIVPYLVFANSHDGSMAITAAMTPTRVVCQNTLTLALREAKRSWSIRHIGDMTQKKRDAAMTLKLATKYMDGMEEEAEKYQQIKISKQMLADIMDFVFPIDKENDSLRVQKNVADMRNQFNDVMIFADDLKKFKGTAWGLYNAFGDFASHIKPLRKTATFQESLFGSFIDGNKLLQRAQDAIIKIAA